VLLSYCAAAIVGLFAVQNNYQQWQDHRMIVPAAQSGLA
jgi:hypothetical protein